VSAQPFPIEVPLLGLNTLDPFIEFDSGYAREFTNVALVNGRVRSRPAVERVINSSVVNEINWFYPNGTTYPAIEKSSGDIILLSNGSVTGNIGGACQAMATRVRHVTLDLVIGCRAPRTANNAGFPAWGFTTGTITATAITSACSYRGRLIVCDGSTVEYSSIGQISGAMVGVFTVSAYMGGQSVVRILNVTAQPGNYATSVIVFFGDQGKVLVFQGDYPGAPNWQIIGDFDMPPPISNNGFVEIDGDIFISTNRYAYWFRDLFQGGAQTAWENSPTKPIENLWQSVFWSNDFAFQEVSHSFYYEPLDCIVCQCFEQDTEFGNLADIADYNNEACYFVYFRRYQAWALWLMAPFFAPVVIDPLQGGPFALGYDNPVRQLNIESMVDYSDTGDVEIETSWKTPYYYPKQGFSKNFAGTTPFFKNTASGYLYLIRAIYDMSDYNTPWGFWTQSTAPVQIPPGHYTQGKIDVAAQTWETYRQFCGVSGNGAGVSLQYSMKRKSGSSADQYQEIFGASGNFEGGGPFPA
jgi:hypothetical protein